MKCPLCKTEIEEKELNTFLDYSDYLYSLLCIESVKKFGKNGSSISERPSMSDDQLELLRKCCETVSRYAYKFDRSVYGYLATPQKEEQPE